MNRLQRFGGVAALLSGLVPGLATGTLAQTTLPTSFRVATGVDTGKPGYLVRTYQVDGVDNNGNIGDLWLKDPAQLVRNADGSLYQNRDTLTISTGKSVFAQDTIDLLNSKVTVTPAVSYRQINRDFTNYASNGSGAGVDYKINKTYSQALPSLSSTLQFTPEVQGFAGVAKNFKAPGNFEYFSLAQGVTFTNVLALANGDGLGSLAGGVAHDYNNMLAVVIGSLLVLIVIEPTRSSIVGLIEITITSEFVPVEGDAGFG